MLAPTKPTNHHYHAVSQRSRTPFENIDNALELYYIQNNIDTYRDHKGRGVFLNFVIEEQFDDSKSEFDKEFGDEFAPYNCPYSDIVNHTVFPIPNYAVIPDESKEAFVSFILKYCYTFNQSPPSAFIKNTILPNVGGHIKPIFTSEPTEHTEDNPWNEIMYMMRLNCNGMDIKYCITLIELCRDNKFNIRNGDVIGVKDIIKSLHATKGQKDTIYKAFQDSIQCVMQKIRVNEIVSDTQRCRTYPKIIKTLQRIAGNAAEFEDETLSAFFMSFGFNTSLLIIDLLTKIQFECINHDRYDVMDNSCFVKRCNDFIRYNILHYKYDGISESPFRECLKVIEIIRKRTITSAHYAAMIQRKDSGIDDNKDDDEKDVNICSLQIFLFALSVSFSKNAFLLSTETQCTVVCRISSFLSNITECTSFKESVDVYIDVFDQIFGGARFNKNMRQNNIGDCMLNKQKHINIQYIDGNIDISDKEYDEYYADNHWYHILRTKRLFIKNIGLSMHKLGDKMKMYWHYYGSMIPLTPKDLFCKWWTLSLVSNDCRNGLNQMDWNQYLSQYSCSFDHELETIYIELLQRMRYDSYLFGKIHDDHYNKNEENKCENIPTFQSRFGTKIALYIPDETVQSLAMDSKHQFMNEFDLRSYIHSAVTSQIKNNEMKLFGDDKAVFDLGIHHKYINTLLYGILHLKDDQWHFDEYHTEKGICTYIGGNMQLPQINKLNISNNNDVELDELRNDIMMIGDYELELESDYDLCSVCTPDSSPSPNHPMTQTFIDKLTKRGALTETNLQMLEQMYLRLDRSLNMRQNESDDDEDEDEEIVNVDPIKHYHSLPRVLLNNNENSDEDGTDSTEYSGSFRSGTPMDGMDSSTQIGQYEVNEDELESLDEEIIMDIGHILDEEIIHIEEYFEVNRDVDYMEVFVTYFFVLM